MAAHAEQSTVLGWLQGARRRPELLPGRPLERHPAHEPGEVGAAGPTRHVRAICCSGGGIRAAAFALGGMQALGRREAGRRSWYEDVDLVTAVSGGSYMAGSFAIVDHELSPTQRAEALPYAPGSPEDNRLRAHTRYLVEDPKIATIGLLSILYGLLLNLLPILGTIYISAKVEGFLLFELGILTHGPNTWFVHHLATYGVVAVALAAAGVLLFAVERIHDVYRSPREPLTDFARAWAIRLLISAAVFALAFVAVPEVLRLLSTSRIDLKPAGVSWGAQLGSFVATTGALVALVKGSVGKFKAKLQTSAGTSGTVATYTKRALRWLAPWAGSAIAVGLLISAFLTWTIGAAYDGLQWSEGVLMLLAAAVILVWQALTDVNRNSIHPFYKERLSSAFAIRRVDADRAEEIRYARPIRLSEFGGDAADSEAAPRRPELVVCAAVNTDEEGVVPAGRGCAPFTFSSHRIGISSGTMFDGERSGANDQLMRPTQDYEEAAGIRLMTLPAAVAVSGAAVSPAMGRMTRAPLRLLLGLANVRLGLWLPNPRISNLPPAPLPNERSPWRLVQWQLHQPGMLSLLRELLGRTGLRGRWIYVTDGGHYENLGLVEALRRGATEIIVFDASGDAPHSWSAFGQAVETARADLGVQIDLDPTPMTPPSDGRTPTLVVEGSCSYPDGVRARLVLCKLAMPKDVPASWDVAAWASSHKTFPHDSTAQQLYGDREFEAYRRLGELGGERALALLQSQAEAKPQDTPAPGRRIDLTKNADAESVPSTAPPPSMPPSPSPSGLPSQLPSQPPSPSQEGEQSAAHA
jgi:hypothetical protein